MLLLNYLDPGSCSRILNRCEIDLLDADSLISDQRLIGILS